MSFWGRIKVTAVLYAVTALVTGLLDAFLQVETLDYLLFHSWVFHAALIVGFLLLAPYVVRAAGISMDGTRDAEGA